MDWKEFFKPNFRKILVFLLPIIFLTVIYLITLAVNSEEWKINKTPVDYVFFHFPCFIESKLICKSSNCCFESIVTQIIGSIMFYSPWFLFSWFIVWVNDKVELRGYLWRKIHETSEPSKKTEPIEKSKTEIPISDNELIKKEQEIRQEEERIKQEKEQIYRTMDETNTKKLFEMGLDLKEGKIRCSNCIKWEPVNKKNLMNMINKHGIEIIWKYKCKECKKKN